MTIFIDRGLPNHREERVSSKPTKFQQRTIREKAHLNCVSFDWHRRSTEMYELRQQERREYRASKRV